MCVVLQENVQTQRVQGQQKNGACVCDVKSLVWTFPAITYENVSNLAQDCGDALQNLETQVTLQYYYTFKSPVYMLDLISVISCTA